MGGSLLQVDPYASLASLVPLRMTFPKKQKVAQLFSGRVWYKYICAQGGTRGTPKWQQRSNEEAPALRA